MPAERKIRNQFTVGSLAAAIARRRDYPEAVGFAIAPLRTRTGARSWHGLNEDLLWEKMGAPGVTLPSVDAGDEVPQLPHSPLNLWEIGFVSQAADIIRPTLMIDPALNVNTSFVDAEDSTARAPASSGEDGKPATPKRVASVVATLLELARAKDKHSLEVLAAAQQNQAQAWEHLRGLVQSHEALIARIEASREETVKHLQDAVAANAQLSNQLAELRENSQMHMTIRELFAGKPEVLMESLKGIAIAVVEKIKA